VSAQLNSARYAKCLEIFYGQKERENKKFLIKEIPGLIPYFGQIWKSAIDEFSNNEIKEALKRIETYQDKEQINKENIILEILSLKRDVSKIIETASTIDLDFIENKIDKSRIKLIQEKKHIDELIDYISNYFSSDWTNTKNGIYLNNFFNFLFFNSEIAKRGKIGNLPDICFNSFFIHSELGVTLKKEDWPFKEDDFEIINKYYNESACLLYKRCEKDGDRGFELLCDFEIFLRNNSPCPIGVFQTEYFTELFVAKPKFPFKLGEDYEIFMKKIKKKDINLNYDIIKLAEKYNCLYLKDSVHIIKEWLNDLAKNDSPLATIILGEYYKFRVFLETHFKILQLLFWYQMLRIRKKRINWILLNLNKPLYDRINLLATDFINDFKIPIELRDVIEFLVKKATLLNSSQSKKRGHISRIKY